MPIPEEGIKILTRSLIRLEGCVYDHFVNLCVDKRFNRKFRVMTGAYRGRKYRLLRSFRARSKAEAYIESLKDEAIKRIN